MIVVEDGSGTNASANSYISIDTLKAYAIARGLDLSNEPDSTLETFIIKAMDYIESKRSEFQGVKTQPSQPLQWPREPVIIDGVLIDSNTLPNELIAAQCSLAVSAKTTSLMVDVLPDQQGPIIKERVEGAIDVQYADISSLSTRTQPVFTHAENLLAPLYQSSLTGGSTGFNCVGVRT